VPDLGAKEARLAEDGEVYFTTPHFDGYPAILVRLDWVAMPELEELLVEAWLSRAPKRLATEYLDAPLRRPLPQDPRPPTRRSPVDRPADPAGGPGARLHQPDLANEADDRRRGDQTAHLDDLRGAVLAAERQATEASRRLWDRVGVDEA
jgi:hypothetical protein